MIKAVSDIVLDMINAVDDDKSLIFIRARAYTFELIKAVSDTVYRQDKCRLS